MLGSVGRGSCMQRMDLDDDRRGGWGTVRERVLRNITSVAVEQSRGLGGSLFFGCR